MPATSEYWLRPECLKRGGRAEEGRGETRKRGVTGGKWNERARSVCPGEYLSRGEVDVFEGRVCLRRVRESGAPRRPREALRVEPEVSETGGKDSRVSAGEKVPERSPGPGPSYEGTSHGLRASGGEGRGCPGAREEVKRRERGRRGSPARRGGPPARGGVLPVRKM